MRPLLAILILAACAPNDRAVQHVLLDRGYDSITLVGPAPECLPERGARWSARRFGNRWDTGVVCCALAAYECEVRVSGS